jgi:alkaline phosphatase
MKRNISITTITLLALFSIALIAAKQKTKHSNHPKKIIFMIGDGMGLTQISGAMSNYKGVNAFERFPVIGLSRTHSADDYVTDSGAGATAFSIGTRTYNNAIGVDKDSVSYPTIFEIVKQKLGWSTGVAVTSSIVHATPAAFYAHVKHRRKYDEIAEYMLNGYCDVAIGGGYKYFEQRKDKRSLLAELRKRGFETSADSLNWKNLDAQKLVYLHAYDGMPRMLDGRKDFLSKATQLAINNLSKNKAGFMLMVEGSQIDWGGHDMNFEYMQTELWDFNETINMVLDYAKQQGDVLVIVTADHETGGLALTENPSNRMSFIPKYTYNEHTGVMVPVFAYGPGAETFSGVYDNTAVYNKILELLHLK